MRRYARPLSEPYPDGRAPGRFTGGDLGSWGDWQAQEHAAAADAGPPVDWSQGAWPCDAGRGGRS